MGTQSLFDGPMSRTNEGPHVRARLDDARGKRSYGRNMPVSETAEVHARGNERSDRASVRDAGSARADNDIEPQRRDDQ